MDDDATDLPAAFRHQRMLDTGALRALAHPLRVQIYDILSQYGPQTASSLSTMTGESTGSTSYHLRALAKHELIREAQGRGNARERWWERPKESISFGSPEALRTPAGRAATQVVMAEFLERRQRQLLRFVSEAMGDSGRLDDDHAMISTATARLTPAQLDELVAQVAALVDRTVQAYRDQVGPNVRPVTIRTDIFPLPEEGH